MNEENGLLIQEYSKNPLQNFALATYTIKQHEGNFICGDDITVYLVIEDNKIQDYSFDGNCSTITTAAASFLSEFIIGEDIQTVLTRSYQTMLDKGFDPLVMMDSGLRSNPSVKSSEKPSNWG
ncbi:MAG: iron-sulfur cluster assembly scaffold protein [candidate division SR1 bacterium]|nr:iron-sulfur cluster assembly scaffold protein [candidate division SR1 bacterium]